MTWRLVMVGTSRSGMEGGRLVLLRSDLGKVGNRRGSRSLTRQGPASR